MISIFYYRSIQFFDDVDNYDNLCLRVKQMKNCSVRDLAFRNFFFYDFLQNKLFYTRKKFVSRLALRACRIQSHKKGVVKTIICNIKSLKCY